MTVVLIYWDYIEADRAVETDESQSCKRYPGFLSAYDCSDSILCVHMGVLSFMTDAGISGFCTVNVTWHGVSPAEDYHQTLQSLDTITVPCLDITTISKCQWYISHDIESVSSLYT